MKFLRDAFDIIEAVNTDHELHTLEFRLQMGNAVFDLGILQTLDELVGVNPDRIRTDRNRPSLEVDAIWRCDRAPVAIGQLQVEIQGSTFPCLQEIGTTAQEVPRIIKGMEPNQVAVQQAAQEVGADGQHPIDLTARERSVQKEADPDILLSQITKLITQHLG